MLNIQGVYQDEGSCQGRFIASKTHTPPGNETADTRRWSWV